MDKKTIRSRLWTLSYPTMISFALQSVYDLVDMAWVGRISKESVAGVTLFSTVFWFFALLNEIIGSSSVSMISQSFGKEDQERTRIVAEQTISFKVLMALLSATLLFFFYKPALSLFNPNAEVMKAAVDYGYIRIYFLPMMFAYYSVNTIFRCTGDSKIPMYIMGFASVLNLILDPLFMFQRIPGIGIRGLGLGVYGAALATVISMTLSFVIGILILFYRKEGVRISLSGLFKLHPSIDKQLLTIGLPSGLEVFVRQLSLALLMKFVTVYGTTAVSVAGIGGKIFNFAFMPIVGFMMGGSALAGQFIGRDEIDHAEATAYIAARINGSLMFLVAIIAFVFPEGVMRVFIDDPEVIAMGAQMIRFTAPVVVMVGYGFGLSVVFSGAGENIAFLITSVLARIVVQLPFLFLVVVVLKKPVNYVWASFLVTEVVEIICLHYFFYRGRWKHKRV